MSRCRESTTGSLCVHVCRTGDRLFHCRAVLAMAVAVSAIVYTRPANAQLLRFSNHREITIPEYTTLRIGPFYSTCVLSQSAGYRYTKGAGTGVDFLFSSRRGQLLKDGSDFPLVTILDFRNYLLITRYMDLDISMRVTYSHYPLETQEDEFFIDLADEGALGNISMEFTLTPFVKGTVYDAFSYHTDFVDTRGLSDLYGGRRYEYFENTGGLNMDWLLAHDRNLALSVSRNDLVPRGGEFQDQESVSYHERVAYEQRLSAFLVAGIRANLSQHIYVATNRPESAFQEYSIFSSAQLTRQTRGMVSAGYAVSAIPSFTGTEERNDLGVMTGQLSLETQLGRDLSHSLKIARSLRPGFLSTFEVSNLYGYEIIWKSEQASAGFYSELNNTESSQSSVNEYTDWNSGLSLSYPLVEYITLLFSTAYSVRKNEAGEFAGIDEDLRTDYRTWSSKVGTSFSVTRNVEFTTSFRHVERESDSEALDFERDIFTAVFTYKYQL